MKLDSINYRSANLKTEKHNILKALHVFNTNAKRKM